MHGLALGVRHAGVLSKEQHIPLVDKGSLSGLPTELRHRKCDYDLAERPMVLLSFSTRTYMVVGLIHFLVFWRI